MTYSYKIGSHSPSILDPGEIPDIKGVNRYPGQERVGGDSKIPTVIYYDANGKVRAVGAEATSGGTVDEASENGWYKAEWFKMHLRPNNPAARRDNLPPLPPNKTVVDVMGDYMRYLHQCAKIYIQETHPGGASLWLSLANNVDFVLSHPNGWEGAQQAQMRRAAILGGLVSNEKDAGARIRFVTEGEASLHFCVQNGLFVQSEGGVLIVDAGGGTIDLSAYSRKLSSEYEEIAPAQYLLEGSKYADDTDHITECFDKSTKLQFKNVDDPAFIKFGTPRDRDADLGVRSGQLRLGGADVASFFDPSVRCVIQAIIEMRQASLKPISHVFLVGGFGASDYLFSKLKQALERLHLDFCRPDTHLCKAVADGAISFYTDHIVSVRVSRRIYGCECSIGYDPNDTEHVQRVSRKYVDSSGEARLDEFFNVVLPKVTIIIHISTLPLYLKSINPPQQNEQVSEKKEFRTSYFEHSQVLPSQFAIKADILCYRGRDPNPRWLDIDSAHIPKTCAAVRKTPGHGKKYFEIWYDIVLAFGLTELQAQVAWREKRRTGQTPSHLVGAMRRAVDAFVDFIQWPYPTHHLSLRVGGIRVNLSVQIMEAGGFSSVSRKCTARSAQKSIWLPIVQMDESGYGEAWFGLNFFNVTIPRSLANKSCPPTEKPLVRSWNPTMTAYLGTQRKLILAFDVGTTYSGISYRLPTVLSSILDPGEIPEIKGVNRYPGQEHVGGDSKIPTVLYYDMDGEVQNAPAPKILGGAALSTAASAKQNGRGRHGRLHAISLPLCENLHPGDTPRGVALWQSLANNVDFVLSHPNGWEGAQQAQMRRAAILGGLVSDEKDAGVRIRFVTEGEASLHFCIRNGLFIQPGGCVLIVDAGGGTIDLSAYSGESSSQFEEIAPAQCHLMGSVFVTQHARKFIEGLLEDSKYVDDAGHIAECFDKSTKLRFKNANEPAFIKFGTPRDQDADLGIRSGQLRLAGADVASFFDPSVQCIIQAIVEMCQTSLKPISHVFLVGGFGASDYLFSKLKHSLGRIQLDLCRPDTHLNKAVANGGISFYIDRFVSVRVSKRVYGCECNTAYDPSNLEHARRVSKKFLNMSGTARLPGSFSVILPKNEQVLETKEFRKSYFREFAVLPVQFTIADEILYYQGHDSNPQWVDADADIPKTCAVVQRTPGHGKNYYIISYDVILVFGLTELHAQVAWKENACTQLLLPYLPLTVVPLFRVKRRGADSHLVALAWYSSVLAEARQNHV
ncbi:hypothetical protein BD779DRAFT_1471330 [Infundibulicybe gibba]|nr:hypothetical protein BD779DRAFT_1471330 [Infundibulicybe gibba]